MTADQSDKGPYDPATTSDQKYRDTPEQIEGMPAGVPYIIGNELAERFSFYGMKCILTVFMTKHLLDAAGQPDFMTEESAKSVYHLFTAGAYFFPMLGAIVADVFWGKYKTILWISLMYCAGHGCLALMDVGPQMGGWGMKPFLYIGLALIAVGAGGIKPCVSAHVGDQFGTGNKHLLTRVFNWFYFSINLGAAVSTILTPILLHRFGPWAAFGLPGVLMAIATFMFWVGRNTFVHVPPSGWAKFAEETFSPVGMRAIFNLAPLFLIFVPVFWAIFDQTGSAWVLQAENMNRSFLGIQWLESQVQAVNPLFILLLIPVFTYVIYPGFEKFLTVTPLRKIGVGFVLTALAFSISAMIESQITQRQAGPAAELWKAVVADDAAPQSFAEMASTAKAAGWKPDQLADYQSRFDGGADQAAVAAELWGAIRSSGDAPSKLSDVVKTARAFNWEQERINPFLDSMPNIGWQFLAYLVLTSAEILVSIVCLEFAYTQSPRRMKSFIMGIYFLGVSLGNVFVSLVNWLMELTKDENGNTFLEGETYYWAFASLMAVTTVIYLVFAMRYKGETFIQGEGDEFAQAQTDDAH